MKPVYASELSLYTKLQDTFLVIREVSFLYKHEESTHVTGGECNEDRFVREEI